MPCLTRAFVLWCVARPMYTYDATYQKPAEHRMLPQNKIPEQTTEAAKTHPLKNTADASPRSANPSSKSFFAQ